ncbi:conjugal transfer protein TrbL family protein [Actinoplanes sp. NPDC020271]|uniref:conjugal transfer protein TrbL family protein n=1 Tax=Actinoplanes sp. NPDC020271 TaxID=3363896 RepID=UPI003795D2ED
MTLLTSTVFMTPDVTVLPQVKSIADKSTLVVNACFILAIIAVGIASMTGESIQMRYGIKELIPRLVVGFVLSAFAMPLTAELISIANALTVAMTGVSAPTTETINFVKARLKAALSDDNNAVLMAIIGLLIVVLMFMLAVSWLIRVGVLIILAGIASVALACYATPWTQGAAALWWRSVLGCLATPALQAVAFTAGIDLVLNPKANLPIVLGQPNSDLLNLLLVIVLLWVTIKIPSLMGKYVTQKGSNIGGIVLRAVFIQGIARRVPLLRGMR